MEQAAIPLNQGSNTAMSEDIGLAANILPVEQDDQASDSASVADQNNLIENNLLPDELEAQKIRKTLENDKKPENVKKEKTTGEFTDVVQSAGLMADRVQEVVDVATWAKDVAIWAEFNAFDRNASATRQDPIKTSAIDWLLNQAPTHQLDSTSANPPTWVPVGWGGKPNYALTISRRILIAIDAAEGARHDVYVTDSANLGIAWPDIGHPDSPYAPSEVRGRPSMKHYNAAVSPQIISKITQTLDPTTAKFWQTSLQLKNETDAMWILRYRAKGAQVGDNHLPLLVAAWQYYFDACRAHAAGLVCSKLGQRTAGYAYNIYKDTNWISSVAEQGKEIVNCIGMPQDYATFWAMCCLPTQEIFAARTDALGTLYKTPFGAWRRRMRTEMCVISEHTVTYPSTAPNWWTNPNLILGFMEMYSMKFGLDDQMNDALYVALLIPLMTVVGTPITLPEPVHSKDWFEGLVELGQGLDAVRQLHLSSPTATTAAWSTSQSVMIGILGEVAEAELAQREGVAISQNTAANVIRTVAMALSRPGSFTATILCKLMHFPSTAIELAGLQTSFVPAGSLVPPPLWNYRRLALWQHNLVPIRASRSYLSHGPNFNRLWKPEGTLTPAHFVTTVNELQVLRRYRILDVVVSGQSELIPFDIVWTASTGRVTIPAMDPALREKIALVKKYGVKLYDVGSAGVGYLDQPERDPAEAVELYNSWQYMGITPSVAGSDVQYGGFVYDRPQTGGLPDDLNGPQAYSITSAIDAAEAAGMMKRQAIFRKLATFGARGEIRTSQGNSSALLPVNSATTEERRDLSENCGWQGLVKLGVGYPTVQALKRAVAGRLGNDPMWTASLPDKLSLDELSVIAGVLKIDLMLVECRLPDQVVTCVVGDPDYKRVLYLADDHWDTHPSRQLLHAATSATSNRSEAVAKPTVEISDKTRAVIYEQAIEKYNVNSLTKQGLLETHADLFPHREPPRSLLAAAPRANSPAESLGAGACECGCARIASKATQACDQILELMAMETAFPHRNATTSKKNNLQVKDICKIIIQKLKNPKTMKPNARFGCAAAWLLRSQGQAAEFVTSVAAWVVSNRIGPAAWKWLWVGKGLYQTNEDDWVAKAKSIHDDLRKHGYPPHVQATEEDWSQSLYLQALYGRGGVLVNWAEDFANKASHPDPIQAWDGRCYSQKLATEIINETVNSVVETAYPKAVPQSFDRFMDNAYEWLVSGSSAGIPSPLKNSPMRDLVLKEYGLSPRPTKRSVMEAIPRDKVLKILTETSPKIVAKAHMKLNETGGKARAIYGVTLWHYIFSNWLMAPVEKHLNHRSVDINLDGSAMLTATLHRLGQVEANMVFNSYDYPDFNSMHTYEHMASIYRAAKRCAIKELRQRRGAQVSDQDLALIEHGFDWLIESVYHQYVIHPDTGAIIKTASGLYSGDRDTTLINTLLNIAYASVTDRSMAHKYVDPGVVERLCHGDDIITVHRSLPGAMLWNDEAAKCNLKGQESKLMIDHKHHEYLRIMGCDDVKLRGCLARCVATYVNGNWETERVVGVWAKLQEAASSLATWIRRGASQEIVQELWYISRYRMLTETYRFTPTDAKSLNIRDSPQSSNTATLSYEQLPANVTSPYIKKLVAELPHDLRPTSKELGQLRRVLQKSTYGTELPLTYQQTDLTKISDGAIETVRTLGGAAGRVFNSPDYHKLKLEGTAKSDWQLRNRIKAVYHLLSAIDLRGRSMSKIELISALTGATRASAARVLEADAELERSAKSAPRWDLPAELASTIVEIEWTQKSILGAWPETLSGSQGTPDARLIADIATLTDNYTSVRVGDVLRY
ncbi:cap-pol fusion protein [Ustilago maydis virus H1]|uniref:RNA-directed RNA polymerase n=12 Tax=Ustilago maydis virus H1 TaxID=28882 RepID=Q90153_9VIRU|nr:cap-pol fusion protein [Ustilago maydis virus H1]AAA81884.1 cap-pol fusion protein [Ustilago maydis virus H1]